MVLFFTAGRIAPLHCFPLAVPLRAPCFFSPRDARSRDVQSLSSFSLPDQKQCRKRTARLSNARLPVRSRRYDSEENQVKMRRFSLGRSVVLRPSRFADPLMTGNGAGGAEKHVVSSLPASVSPPSPWRDDQRSPYGSLQDAMFLNHRLSALFKT